MHTFL
jgi:hypothetical protein